MHGKVTMLYRFRRWLDDLRNPPVVCRTPEELAQSIRDTISNSAGIKGKFNVGVKIGDGKSSPIIQLNLSRQNADGDDG